MEGLRVLLYLLCIWNWKHFSGLVSEQTNQWSRSWASENPRRWGGVGMMPFLACLVRCFFWVSVVRISCIHLLIYFPSFVSPGGYPWRRLRCGLRRSGHSSTLHPPQKSVNMVSEKNDCNTLQVWQLGWLHWQLGWRKMANRKKTPPPPIIIISSSVLHLSFDFII